MNILNILFGGGIIIAAILQIRHIFKGKSWRDLSMDDWSSAGLNGLFVTIGIILIFTP